MDIDLFQDRNAVDRPMLGGHNTGDRLRELKRIRESYYNRSIYK